jgi:hypothetical protein
MKALNNNTMERLKGYLDALDDINGGQREFTTVASLIYTEDNNILDEIQLFSRNTQMENLKVLKKVKYKHSYGVGSFLKILLLSKPFSGLYPPYNSHSIPREIVEQFRKYTIGHIEDLIDIIFYKEGVGLKENRDVEILLLKNKEQYFITITIESKSIKILLFFYRKLFSRDEFYELFDSLIEDNQSI